MSALTLSEQAGAAGIVLVVVLAALVGLAIGYHFQPRGRGRGRRS